MPFPNNYPGFDHIIVKSSLYEYNPSLPFAIIGLTTFTLSTIAHGWQIFHYRMWWCSILVLGGVTEVIGYAGRLWSHYQDWNNAPFLMQTVRTEDGSLLSRSLRQG